jgi:hypothetical protein
MLAIIVPYRDRKIHLDQFIPHMNKFLPEAQIIVVEQTDQKEFNRAKLLNIGTLHTKADHYCFHDVDKLPIKGNYSYPDFPRQIAPNPFQTQSYFGGVTLFNKKHFEQVDGYNNEYWGWGGEDNEMMFQLYLYKKIPIVWQYGEFIDLPHPRPASEFEFAKWERSKKKRNVKDGLISIDYHLISKEVHDTNVHLKVTL